MFKCCDFLYGVGCICDLGLWWKWKIDLFSVDVVLIYVQCGYGCWVSLYSDYIFVVWDDFMFDGELVVWKEFVIGSGVVFGI